MLLGKIFFVFLMLSSLLVSSCGLAQQGAITGAHKAYGRGDYVKALAQLSGAEKYTTPSAEVQAEILFLRALCWEKLSRLADANGLYEHIVQKFPESQYAAQARATLHERRFVVAQPIYTIAAICRRSTP